MDIQGHRGARGLLPENTIAGFVKALEVGATTLEMDAVISADEQVVISHEPWLAATYCSHPDGRPVGEEEERTLNIFRMPYEEVKTFDCGRRGHPAFPEQEARPAIKPLLREVIRAGEVYLTEQGIDPFQYSVETKCWPDGDGEYHPKPEKFTRLLHGALKEEGVLDRSIIQSFDVRSLQVARRINPEWRTSILIDRERDEGIQANLKHLGFTPSIYSPDHELVDEALVSAAHEAGMLIIPWTINDRDAMERLAGMGVDGIITDYPDLAVDALRRS